MNMKIMILLVNSLSILFMSQETGAIRNVSDIYRMDLSKLKSGSREDKSPCTSRQDCNFLGSCRGDPGEKYCDCFRGISGRNCEIIDECVDNPGMCGDDPDAVCGFHRNKRRAICECETFGKRFDIPTKKCVAQKPCQNQKQCLNGAVCEDEHFSGSGEGPHYCHCKFGTSGDFCERVEECIDNPKYCGDGDKVECRYNTYLERAYCQCTDQNQRFDWPLKKCVDRTKCRTNEDCMPFGVCHNKCTQWEPCLDYYHIEKIRSCHCVEGTSGEHCEVIDDCLNKIVDCGTSDKVTCDYYYNHGLAAYAYCRCKDRSLTFDHHDKQCKVCDCGPKATSCSFIDGDKTCTCHRGSFNHGDRCEDCKCGDESTGCNITNGVKECVCNPGYKQLNDTCEKCDCGRNSKECTFSEDGKKFCTCEPGFIPGNYSICTPTCNDERVCKNGGRCLQNICMCLAGTGGPYCEIIYDCEKSLCGEKDDAVCQYDVFEQRTYCQCSSMHHTFDSYDKSCKRCSCGSSLGTDWERCDFVLGKKLCQCSQGYAYNPKIDECSKCDCGYNSKICSFEDKGEKACQCQEGYIDYLGTCKECNCGMNGICQFEVFEADGSPIKECKCDFNYQDNNGTCLKCHCGANGECLFDNNGNFSMCLCDSGFAENSRKCEFCDCGPKSKCTFQNKRKVCGCAKGYKEDEGYCTDIDECLNTEACLGPGTHCENTLGSYKCRCQLGYQGRSPTETDKSLCEKIAEMEPNYTPWKIGYGILTVGFILIIIGLVYIIFRLRKNS